MVRDLIEKIKGLFIMEKPEVKKFSSDQSLFPHETSASSSQEKMEEQDKK